MAAMESRGVLTRRKVRVSRVPADASAGARQAMKTRGIKIDRFMEEPHGRKTGRSSKGDCRRDSNTVKELDRFWPSMEAWLQSTVVEFAQRVIRGSKHVQKNPPPRG